MTNPLHELRKMGQSIWYDNLNRQLLANRELQRMVDEDGVTGGTSNPSIFQKALAESDAYDDNLRELVEQGMDVPQIYDELTVTDVRGSAHIFRPAYDESKAADGYASLEVSPDLANDTQGSIDAARRLFEKLDAPNAMIKIPGTQAGLRAIEQCLEDGLNINITLLFGVENYEQVAWAYISALEKRWAANKPIDRIGSVASFFVSRVDTLVDEKLEAKIAAAATEPEKAHLRSLLGKAGVANARIAYEKFQEIFASPRWLVLADHGALPQRCLWASTGTKNPAYRDVLYIEELMGPDTINTMPQATLDAFKDHGKVARTLDQGLDEAHATIAQLKQAGINFQQVTDELQVKGVELFCDAFNKANETLKQKHDAALAARGSSITASARD